MIWKVSLTWCTKSMSFHTNFTAKKILQKFVIILNHRSCGGPSAAETLLDPCLMVYWIGQCLWSKCNGVDAQGEFDGIFDIEFALNKLLVSKDHRHALRWKITDLFDST